MSLHRLPLPAPSAENGFLLEHARLLRLSYRRLTGRELVDPGLGDAQAAQALYEAPFALLSHGVESDPILAYGNRAALRLFGLDWDRLVAMPSRLTAEAPERAERQRLLEQVRAKGFVEGYSGVRISATGRRFRIREGLVWTLSSDGGDPLGQAATFADWSWL